MTELTDYESLCEAWRVHAEKGVRASIEKAHQAERQWMIDRVLILSRAGLKLNQLGGSFEV